MEFSDYKVHEVIPGLWCVPIPMTGNPLKELNSYIIKGDISKGERHLVIDTGFHWDECYGAMIDGFNTIGIKREDIDILVTHLHGDHAGNAQFLAAENSKVYMSEIDRRYIRNLSGEVDYADVLWRKAERLLKSGVPRNRYDEMIDNTFGGNMKIEGTFAGYTPIKEGDELKYGGYSLKAIHTPGHTPGHMCFLIENTGAMILGDHVLFDITPNITDWPDQKDPLGDYLDSLNKIDSYDITIPLPAHRLPGDFHGRIAALNNHHKKRIRECYEIIEQLGDAYAYDIAGRMKWKIRSDNWETFPATQRWFAMGECFAHIDYLKTRGYIEEKTDGNGILYYCAVRPLI